MTETEEPAAPDEDPREVPTRAGDEGGATRAIPLANPPDATPRKRAPRGEGEERRATGNPGAAGAEGAESDS